MNHPPGKQASPDFTHETFDLSGTHRFWDAARAIYELIRKLAPRSLQISFFYIGLQYMFTALDKANALDKRATKIWKNFKSSDLYALSEEELYMRCMIMLGFGTVIALLLRILERK